MRMKVRYFFEIMLIVLLVALSITIFLFRDELQSIGWRSYLGLLVLCFLANSTILLPSPSLMIATSYIFVLNPFLVVVLGSLGSTCGEFTGYIFGQVTKDISVKAYEVFEFLKNKVKNPLILIFILALLPLPLFDIAGIYAGGTKVNHFKFFLACYFGKFIKMFIYVCILKLVEAFIPMFIGNLSVYKMALA